MLVAPNWQSKRWWPAGALPPESVKGPPTSPPIVAPRVRRTRGRRGGRRQRQRRQSKEGRTKRWIPKQIQQQETTTHQTKTEPAKQFALNDAAKEFVPLDRQKEAQEVQTLDEVESTPSISKQEFPKGAPQVASSTKRKKVKHERHNKRTNVITK